MSSRKRKAVDAFQTGSPRTPSATLPCNTSDDVETSNKLPITNGNRSSTKPSLREKAQVLRETRRKLPIWPHADEVLKKVSEHDVLLLVGETGSGKSTQIPQFLYNEKWCRPQHIGERQQRMGGRIAILQPRRVAAISLANRVASEIGTPLGTASPASQVGYSVRFDNNVSTSTRIKFLTDGMLLQELLRDHWLKEYSCVIVDEVHERGVNVDLVLGFLKQILDAHKSGKQDHRQGVPLKVIVMSATAEMEGIEKFFLDTPELQQAANGDQTPKADEDDFAGFSDDEKLVNNTDQQAKHTISVASCHIKGRQYPVTLSYVPQPVINLLDTTMDKITYIHQHTPLPADILVFLSGQEMIENLESLCNIYATTLADKEKQQKQKLPALQTLPLFASLPNHLQARVFQPASAFTRRVILSTNIAETSVTVPNVRHIIDTGKHKARLFRPGLNLDTLLSTPISQSMARQRAGRAGREGPGTCHRLYTEKDFWNLEKDTKPEILSTDLSFLVLTLKAHGVADVLGFPLLTKPPRRSLEAALEGLLNLGALDGETGDITEIGRKMATLPVRPDLARCLLEGSKHGQDVMDAVVDVVAALSLEEGIFLPVRNGQTGKQSTKKMGTKELLLGEKDGLNGHTNGNSAALHNDAEHPESDEDISNPIETARRKLLSRHSDHLTLANAICTYSSPSTSDRRAWCDAHGISHRAMSRIMDVRKQLRQMMSNPKYRLVPSTSNTIAENIEANGTLADLVKKELVLKCLVAGLWPNVAVLSSLTPSQAGQVKQNPNQRAPYTTLLTNQPIHIHPSSVLFTHRGGGGAFAKKDRDDENDKKRKSSGVGTSTMPRSIIFTDLIYTSKPYARNVSAVELSWVAELGRLS
ncbi:Salivary acidic proline-rich phosphoprotein 1/2 [Lithohypha guttulata]|uniref:RNA helicase n=1 Tax=Lithohypha guttulata TaxID=1690604 RepID=A0AAN7SWI4_9EURO|nr:Salivary acidic proline-rich phosphoprotein 1/2 [Lithohypha guttulata]